MKQCTLILLFNNQGQILLAMKKRGFGVGKRNGPGGKVQEGETIIQGALRELQEETHIILSESDLSQKGLFHFYFRDNPERDMDVHLFVGQYDGDFSETEEMKPQRRNIDSIPYDLMRDDDRYRLPRLIANPNDTLEYSFTFDTDGKVIDHKLLQ